MNQRHSLNFFDEKNPRKYTYEFYDSDNKSENSPFSDRYVVSCCFTKYSKIRDTMGNRDTGLKFFGTETSPDLKSGLI